MHIKTRHSILGLMAALLIILAGCGHAQSKQQSSNSSSSKSSVVSSSKKSSKKITSSSQKKQNTTTNETATPWSSDKSSKLAQFMQQWGNIMGQQYEEYTQSNPVDFYGLKVPTDLNAMPPAVGDAKISYTLSSDGKTTADYAIVAIYSDAATTPYPGQHLYLFTLHHGKPEVLVTMQNQGNDNGWLYFKTSDNNDLNNGFAQIVAGQAVPAVGSSESSDTKTAAVGAKTAGILLLLYANPEWLKDYIDSSMWYGINPSSDGLGIPAGYSYITAHGDPTSFIYYSVDGDTITYKYVDETKGTTVANSPVVTKTVSLSQLEKDFYGTEDQKQEVDGYVAQLMDN